MIEKLDPTLRAIADEAQPLESMRQVTVIVALNAPAGPDEVEQMKARGLATRSVIGDIITGQIALENLAQLAAYPAVVKIEASGPMFRE